MILPTRIFSRLTRTTTLVCASLLTISACQGSDYNAATTITVPQQPDCETVDYAPATDIKNLIGGTVSAETIDAFLASRVDGSNIPGASVAIINDRQIVYHRTLGVANTNTGDPITNCSIFQGASITKPLFGYFVMTFVEDGMLDLDRPLHEYLPYPDIAHDDRYKAITARMALTHQTGFPNWRSDAEDKKLTIGFQPGTGFSYSGEGYQYLSLVLQEIAGVDHAGLEAIFQERVAKPLGMNHTEVIPSDALLRRLVSPHVDGKPVIVREENSYEDFGAAYGIHSEAADFSKWLIGLMNEEGLSEVSFKTYFTRQNVPVPQDDNPLILSQDYALGFVVYDTPLGELYAHNGNNPGFSSLIVLEREQGWGIVVFSNGNQTSDLGLELTLFMNAPS